MNDIAAPVGPGILDNFWQGLTGSQEKNSDRDSAVRSSQDHAGHEHGSHESHASHHGHQSHQGHERASHGKLYLIIGLVFILFLGYLIYRFWWGQNQKPSTNDFDFADRGQTNVSRDRLLKLRQLNNKGGQSLAGESKARQSPQGDESQVERNQSKTSAVKTSSASGSQGFATPPARRTVHFAPDTQERQAESGKLKGVLKPRQMSQLSQSRQVKGPENLGSLSTSQVEQEDQELLDKQVEVQRRKITELEQRLKQLEQQVVNVQYSE